MRALPVLLLSFVVGCVFLMLTAGSASAATAYTHLGAFGGTGSGDGQFSNPNRIAVDTSTGNIFVADTGNDRIEVFEPTASGADYLTSFGAAVLESPIGVAVDADTGDVYVTDNVANAIFKFNSDGAETPAYTEDATFTSPAQGTGNGQIGNFGITLPLGSTQGGIAVDPTTGDIVIADPGRNLIQRFDSDGAFLSSFNGFSIVPLSLAFTGIRDLAVDAAGNVTVADTETSGSGRVRRFNAAGALQAALGPVPNPVTGTTGVVLTSDRGSGETLVSSRTSIVGAGKIYRVGSDGTDQGTLGVAGDAIGPIFGVAAAGGDPERIYVIAKGTSLVNPPTTVQVFEGVTLPAAEMVDITGIGGTTATATGTVNPEGGEVTDCHFEYVPQAQFDEEQFESAERADCDPTPGAGTDDVDVHAALDELEPNTAYVVRLVASKGGGVNTASDKLSFTTDAVPPVAVTGRAWSVSDSTATLAARVNPRNSATTYRFEYTDEADFQAHGFDQAISLPEPAGDAGAGGSPVQVSVDIDGLEPESAYRFRVVADNGVGDEQEGDDAGFKSRSEADVTFSERGFELVSPADTNGIRVFPGYASDDGERSEWGTTSPVPGSENGNWGHFVATRSADGAWSQNEVGAPPPPTGELVQGKSTRPLYSSDLSVAVFSTAQGVDPDDQNGASDTYVQDAEGGLTWISRNPQMAPGIPQTEPGDAGNVQYLSPDGKQVVFRSSRHLLPEDVSGSGSSNRALYEWNDGELRLVGIAPGASTGLETGSALGSSAFGQEVRTIKNAVSLDRTRIAFQTDGTPRPQLYVRIDGAETVQASASEGVEPPVTTPLDVMYWGSDRDVGTVFFSSASALTDDSDAPNSQGGPADLYAYQVPADGNPANGRLTDLTPHTGGAGVSRVLAVADDGNRVYFSADNRLTDGEGSADGPNIYLAERTGPGAQFDLNLVASGLVELGEYVSPQLEAYRNLASNSDASVFTFLSSDDLVPGRRTGNKPQVFVYEAEQDALSCASCPADGSAASTDASLTPFMYRHRDSGNYEVGGISNPDQPHVRNVASDGTVFFNTGTKLSRQDSNGAVDDVYAYRSGRVSLISAGTGSVGSTFADASIDGSTVFIASRDSLVPGVQAGTRRIFAARVGGGYTPPTETPPCTGDDCRDPGTQAPDDVSPGSGEFTGPGNQPKTANRCAHSERRAARSAKRKRQATRQARSLKRRAARAIGKRAHRLERRSKRAQRRAKRIARVAEAQAREVRTCRRGGK